MLNIFPRRFKPGENVVPGYLHDFFQELTRSTCFDGSSAAG